MGTKIMSWDDKDWLTRHAILYDNTTSKARWGNKKQKEKIMGKMAELDAILQLGDKELLEEFFLKRGFSRYAANKARDEFTKAYEELQNYQKKEKSDGKKDTKTKNIK